MTTNNYTHLTNQVLVELVIQNIKTKILPASVRKFDVNLYDEIVQRTKFLDDVLIKVSIQTRLYCLEHNITKYPKCPRDGCNNNATWWTFGRRFAHCCVRCSQLDQKTRDKYKQTCQQKWGTDNAFQSEEIKQKIGETMVERYGVNNPSKSQEFQRRKKSTWMHKYGCSHPLKNKEIKNKQRTTNEIRYGGPAPMCSSEIKKKMENTCKERYGGIGMASPVLSKKTIDRTIELYGKTPTQISHESLQTIVKSKSEQELDDFISSIYHGQIELNNRSVLSMGKELDIYLPNIKIAIEFNGDYWHMNPMIYSESDYNSQLHMSASQKWEYDKQKADECEQLGIKLIIVWEHDWTHNQQSIKNMICDILQTDC